MPNFEKISMQFNKNISFNESLKNEVSHAFTGYIENSKASIDEGFFQIPCFNSIIRYVLDNGAKIKKLS